MKTNGNSKQSRRAGFSMVEVLVASSIMVVIVMLLGMLFQQTSLAWRTGVKRADGFVQIRSAIGAIQRDAAAAVDARYLPKELRAQLGDGSAKGDQLFIGSSLKFYTLTGTGFDDKKITPFRALTHVTYDTTGKRTESILKADGSTETKPSSNVSKVAERVGNKNAPVTQFYNFNAEYGTGQPQEGLPLFVTLSADVTTMGNSLEIGAESAGPDGIWGNKDDIKTWSNP